MDNIKIFEDDLPPEIDLSNEKLIGIDNEALGLVLGRDPLTLVQLGLESKQFYLIKLNRKTYEAPNLTKALSNPSTQFIMHYARQDLLWLKYHLNVEPKNIFCTKVASKLARTASSFHGYKDLVKELCGKDISKKEQQSDWGNPNLSTKQINYAAQDTEYLFEIKDKLTKMLIREKRIDLFEKCMKVIPVLVDMEISGYKLWFTNPPSDIIIYQHYYNDSYEGIANAQSSSTNVNEWTVTGLDLLRTTQTYYTIKLNNDTGTKCVFTGGYIIIERCISAFDGSNCGW